MSNTSIVLKYPRTGNVMAEGFINKDGKLTANMKVYADDSSKTLIKNMIFSEGKLVSSETIFNDKIVKMNYNESANKANMIILKNSIDFIKMLGLTVVDKKSLKLDGTTQDIYTDSLVLNSTIIEDEHGNVKNLSLLEIKSSDGNCLKLNYRDVGSGDQIIDITMENPNHINVVRKIYVDYNFVKPNHIVISNRKNDSIEGVFVNHDQTPTLGKSRT